MPFVGIIVEVFVKHKIKEEEKDNFSRYIN
jgi:hypothetical protein